MNSSGSQSEYSAASRTNSFPSKSNATTSSNSSISASNETVSASCPSVNGDGGPGSSPLTTLPSRSIRMRAPPVYDPAFSRSVVNTVKLPWLPRRSGTHIAERRTPFLSFSGGNVIGTRRMWHGM